MIKKVITSKPACLSLLIFFALAFSAFQTVPQRLSSVILTNEQLIIKPVRFYIDDVEDELNSHEPVALLVSQVKGLPPQTYTSDLKDGPVLSVKRFIVASLPRSTALSPIIIGLKKISIKETAQANNRVEGHVAVIFSFYLRKGDDDKVYLADYSGSAVYNRDPGQIQYIEPVLRKVLVNGLSYVNTWMGQQSGNNIKLAKKVEVSFSDYEDQTEGDSIYYSNKRPLMWADFRGIPPVSKYSAEVFPVLGYDQRAELANGVIKLHLTLKACLPKSAAWAKNNSRNDYTLNHEQRHFDIVKLTAEHFKKEIAGSNLLPDTYEGIVNVKYLDAYREMTAMQMLYDKETSHGIDTAEQERWNAKIDKELKELGVK